MKSDLDNYKSDLINLLSAESEMNRATIHFNEVFKALNKKYRPDTGLPLIETLVLEIKSKIADEVLNG